MTEYTPDTKSVELAYVAHRSPSVELIAGHHEIHRWLDRVRAEAKAEALEEAASDLERGIPVAKSTPEWLRDRAHRCTEGS